MAIGACSGFLGGLLGIGGGVVIVPALILLFDGFGILPSGLVTIVAVATSLACIVFTSLAAAYAQIRRNMVDWRVVRRWTGYLLAGSFLAGSVAETLSVIVFRSLIGCFLLFVAVVMLTSWKPSAHRRFPGLAVSAGLGSLGGLISGIAGIGGGNVVVPTLVYFNIPLHRATATSSALGVPIATAGALGYIATGWNEPALGQISVLGYVYLPALAAIVAATLVAAPLGVRAAHALDPGPLRKIFGGLLVLVATRMLYMALVA